jgi:hypothetical protein
MAEVNVLMEERRVGRDDALKTDCEVRTGRPPGL